MVGLFNFVPSEKKIMTMMITKSMILFVFGAFLLLQCTNNKNYDPGLTLSPQEKDELKMKVIRYVAKPPENVGPEEKFKPEYNLYYQERASQCILEQYAILNELHYFLISQPAPSLTEKRHATGGSFRLDSDGSLQDYEEVFRTWKMVPDTLRERSYLLFDKMVNKEPLDPFYSKKMGDRYIEFPDDNTYFDKASRSWKTR